MQTTSKNLTPELIAQLFGVERVIVPDMIYSTAALTSTIRGTTGIESGAFIWDKDIDGDDYLGIIYAYVNPKGGLRSLTYGWNLWTEQLSTRRFPEPKNRKEWIENGVIEQQKVVAASCIYRVKVWTS
jgi:hypothetical protein